MWLGGVVACVGFFVCLTLGAPPRLATFSLLETGSVYALCCTHDCGEEVGLGLVGVLLGWFGWLLCWVCCWVGLALFASASSLLPGCPPSWGRVHPLLQRRPRASFILISMHVSAVQGLPTLLFGPLVWVVWLWALVFFSAVGVGSGTATGYKDRQFAVDRGLHHASVESSTCNLLRGGPLVCFAWVFLYGCLLRSRFRGPSFRRFLSIPCNGC